MLRVISTSDIGQAASTGEIPLLFSRSAVGSLKSPVLGGRMEIQTGDERPFSLTAPGSDPQLGIEPRPHW